MAERIAQVGYINSAREHALISIYDPAILNPGKNSVQVAITVASARRLHEELERFLAAHDYSN